MNYSQNDEQSVIAEYFTEHGTACNRFLDIGANDGTLFSNTRALADVGWHGVLVEAAPGPFAELLKLYGGRNGITLVNAAVAGTAGWQTFHASDANPEHGDMVGTLDQLHAEKWSTAVDYRPFRVHTVTPRQLLDECGWSFDFINIDVEGLSAWLFQELWHQGLHARCWCVEHDEQTESILQLAQTRGLTQIAWNQENVIMGLCSP